MSEGLVVGDLAIFQKKIAEFIKVGANGLHVVFDFDRTLTVKNPGSDDEVTVRAPAIKPN